MYNIESDLNNGILKISDSFDITAATQSIDATPYFLAPGDEYVLSFPNIQNVIKLTKFEYDTLGINDDRYLLQYYRISRDGLVWTDWLDLNRFIENFPVVDTLDPLFLEIKWVRNGYSTIGSIRLLEYLIEGELQRNEASSDGTVTVSSGESKVIKVTDIYKVFKITDLEIIPSNLEGVSLKYRYSQDSTRTWSEWEPLTKENISTAKMG